MNKKEKILYDAFFCLFEQANILLKDCSIENIAEAQELLRMCLQISNITRLSEVLSSPSQPKNNPCIFSASLSSSHNAWQYSRCKNRNCKVVCQDTL